MALAYVPPGVNIEELYSPSVNPLLAANAQVCIVGLAQGYEVATATINMSDVAAGGPITLTAPSDSVFSTVSTTQFFESVSNFNDPSAGSGTDGTYVQGSTAGDGVDFTATLSGDKKTLTVTPVADGSMDLDSGFVVFRYRHTHDMYYTATRYDNSAAVEARYGPSFGLNGIVTPLTAAALIAFENGAPSVVIQPVFRLSDAANPDSLRRQPTLGNGGEYFESATWQQTMLGLRGVDDVNVIVPAVGQSQGFTDSAVLGVFQTIQDHMYYEKTQGQLMVCLFGEDSSASTSVATAPTLRAHAAVLRDRLGGQVADSTVMVSPSRFKRRSTTVSSTDLLIGAQYAAAAVAGMLANRPTPQPLTRKQVSGFTAVSDPRDKNAKDADAAAGLLVIEQRGQSIQVRHGLTVDNRSTASRELSVVRSKHRMVESIRDTIETQIIGEVPADGNAPMTVKQAVIGVLETLRQRRELVDYYGVQSRTVTNDPTTVECRFTYRPAFPLNYVNIVFSLDMSSGDIETTFGDTTGT